MRLRSALLHAFAVAACAPAPRSPVGESVTIVVGLPPEAAQPPSAAEVKLPSLPEGIVVPRPWQHVTISADARDALWAARRLQQALLVEPARDTDGRDEPRRQWFIHFQEGAERVSTRYAEVFFATDAAVDDRIAAAGEAAEAAFTWAVRLERASLAKLPAAWSHDPRLGLTFEDVAMGPAARWRSQAGTLARLCLHASREHGDHPIVPTCERLKKVDGAPPNDRPPSTCPCASGDPLCSASLGGFCAP